jgi:hypothetical protein
MLKHCEARLLLQERTVQTIPSIATLPSHNNNIDNNNVDGGYTMGLQGALEAVCDCVQIELHGLC